MLGSHQPPENDWLCIALATVGTGTLLGLWWFNRNVKEMVERRERHEASQCQVCGYDLRATPERCPECGTPVAPPGEEPIALDPQRLSADWPVDAIDPRQPDVNDPPAVLYVTYHRTEAELVNEQLKARGVWSAIRPRDRYSHIGPMSRRDVVYQLLVPESELERAMTILDRFRLARSTAPMEPTPGDDA